MSSSRSIAAARNRRAMEQQQPNLLQRSRPNTSIASQPAFSQIQQSQQVNQNRGNFKQPNSNNSNNQNNPNNPNNNNKSNRNFHSGQAPGSIPVAINKISVSDAIGLITIRLGRVEQYMQSLDEQGFLPNSSSTDENKIFVNKEMMDNLMDRIYSLENKPVQVETITDNNQMEKFITIISDLEKEVISLKRIITQQTNKIDNLMVETENKFIDIENAFIDLEKKDLFEKLATDNGENIKLVLKEGLEEQEEEQDEEQEIILEPTFSKIDLKNIINHELANEVIN